MGSLDTSSGAKSIFPVISVFEGTSTVFEYTYGFFSVLYEYPRIRLGCSNRYFGKPIGFHTFENQKGILGHVTKVRKPIE